MQDFIDGILSAQEIDRRNHLEKCQICQNTLKQYKNIYVGLEKDPGYKLPHNFAKAVTSKLTKAQKAPFLSPTVEIGLIITGIILAMGTTFYFVDLKPFTETISRIAFQKLTLNTSFLQPIKNLLSGLNGSLILLPFAALALLAVAFLDRIIHKLKHHKLSL